MRIERLFILTIIVVMLYIVVNVTKTESKTNYYETQILAAEKASEAFAAIKVEQIRLGHLIDVRTDPFASGMIGLPWPMLDEPNNITTTLGTLEAKQLSTNPNFAALMIHYFHKLNIKSGDYVAVNFSGSFPALNIATLAAIEVMGLKPIIASSIGASTYGANRPDFPYVKMEKLLYDKGIISHKSKFISLGGDNDQLREVEDESFKLSLLNDFDTSEYEIININSLSENIQKRYKDYHQLSIDPKAFINVGGNMVSFGTHTSYYPNGLIKRRSVSVAPNSGLIERFLRDDVPVIQLLNIKDLARENQMQITMDTQFIIGEGSMYYDYKYSKWVLIPSLTIVTGYVILDYFKRKNKLRTKVTKIG